jgi:hypothetical protein
MAGEDQRPVKRRCCCETRKPGPLGDPTRMTVRAAVLMLVEVAVRESTAVLPRCHAVRGDAMEGVLRVVLRSEHGLRARAAAENRPCRERERAWITRPG